jgi:chitinase
VLFEGTPYLAKWWNEGDSPAAASSNAGGSPWIALTQQQINDVLDELEKAKAKATPKR